VGAIEEYDIENLDTMLKGLRVIYPFARLLLGFERRVIGLMGRGEKKEFRVCGLRRNCA